MRARRCIHPKKDAPNFEEQYALHRSAFRGGNAGRQEKDFAIADEEFAKR